MKKLFAIIVFFAAAALVFGQNYNHVTVIDSNFENGTLDGWGPRGSPERGLEKLEVVKDVKHGGTSAMKISNRTYTWNGPIHKLTDAPKPGDVYSMTAWIFFNEGPNTAAFTYSVETSFKDASRAHAYQNVTSFQVKKNEWTEIKSEYTINGDPAQAGLWIYFELPYKEDNLVTANDKISFYMDDIKVLKLDPASRPKAEMNIPDLHAAWSKSFDIGTAVSLADIDTTLQTSQILMKHFTVITAENEQKMDTVQPTEGKFNWDPAEKIISFGEMTGMRLRWHPLVQHTQNPAWVFQDKANPSKPVTKAVLEQRLKTHIQTIVRKYRNRIDSYDVINEALSDRSGLRTGAEGSKWHEILGPDYIDNAFKWAREADPKAQLVINDYNLESDARKREEMYKLVQGMKQRKIPVDAIGMQMHISLKSPSVQEIQQTIERFASLGVKVMITELDISIYGGPGEAKKDVTPELLLEQAQRYKDIFAMLKDQATKGNLADMVLVWGASDATSWKNNYPVPGRTDAPLLFDTRLQAKPAFWGLVQPSRVQGLR